MSRWRPSPGEERWLEVEARFRGVVPRAIVEARAGGWRTTGPFARVALFVLGVLAAALADAVLGFGGEEGLLVSGLAAATAAEWLNSRRRLHASGVEEGLCTAAYLMIGVWFASKAASMHHGAGDVFWFRMAIVAATAAAGLRLLNPALTTCAALVALDWFGSTQLARAIGGTAGPELPAFVVAVVAASAALFAGARAYRRPSHDRMLDWLVVALPVFAYAQQAGWSPMSADSGATDPATSRVVVALLLLAFGAASLVSGLRKRRHAPVIAALGCLVCLAIELARATFWPVEHWLVLYGAAAISLAATIERYVRQPRHGVTSARLTDREGPFDLLQTLAVSALPRGSAAGPAPAGPDASPRDGRFGGGGASGPF